jgi:hypothetical protein
MAEITNAQGNLRLTTSQAWENLFVFPCDYLTDSLPFADHL